MIESYEINLDGPRGVTEVRLAAQKAAVRVTKAYAITASGQYLELPSLQGDVGAQGTKSIRLDSRFAIRLQRLVIEATSPQLIGSRGQLEVVVDQLANCLDTNASLATQQYFLLDLSLQK